VPEKPLPNLNQLSSYQLAPELMLSSSCSKSVPLAETEEEAVSDVSVALLAVLVVISESELFIEVEVAVEVEVEVEIVVDACGVTVTAGVDGGVTFTLGLEIETPPEKGIAREGALEEAVVVVAIALVVALVVVAASYAPNTCPSVEEGNSSTLSASSSLSERYHFPAVMLVYPDIGSGSYAENVPSLAMLSIAK